MQKPHVWLDILKFNRLNSQQLKDLKAKMTNIDEMDRGGALGALGHSASNEGAWWACIEKRDGTPLNVTTWHIQSAGWPTRCNVAEIWARCSDDSFFGIP